MKAKHNTFIKVRGYHVDSNQHVNNARYLEFLEEARWSLLEEHQDFNFLVHNQIALVVVNININFRQEAIVHQELVIDSWLSHIGHKSAIFTQQVFNNKTRELIADAKITFVCLEQKTNKAQRLTDELYTFLSKYLYLPTT